MNTSDLRMYLRRGDSPMEGVSAKEFSATYFWSPVSQRGTQHNLGLTVVKVRVPVAKISLGPKHSECPGGIRIYKFEIPVIFLRYKDDCGDTDV